MSTHPVRDMAPGLEPRAMLTTTTVAAKAPRGCLHGTPA